jgi:hypothetical protein
MSSRSAVAVAPRPDRARDALPPASPPNIIRKNSEKPPRSAASPLVRNS